MKNSSITNSKDKKIGFNNILKGKSSAEIVDAFFKQGFSVKDIFSACENNDMNMIDELIEKKLITIIDEKGRTILMHAIMHNNFEIAIKLIDKLPRSLVTKRDDQGTTALFYIIKHISENKKLEKLEEIELDLAKKLITYTDDNFIVNVLLAVIEEKYVF